MVLEIRLKNFFSIKEEVILDLRAGEGIDSLKENTFTIKDETLLKTTAIYGANASGKSTIIKAIRFCNRLIFNSHNHNENTIFNFQPFKFDGYSKKPSEYSILFLTGDAKYEYSFLLTGKEILKEELYFYPNFKKNKVKIFTRDETKGVDKKKNFSFNGNTISRPYDVVENTSNKTLYISRASQMDRDIPKKIFTYFYNKFILSVKSFSYSSGLTHKYKKELLNSFSSVDSDIINFEEEIKQEKVKNFEVNPITEELSTKEWVENFIKIKTSHKYNPEIQFDLAEESEGTIKTFLMLPTIIDVIKENKILLIDEIESSLHPHIVDYILTLFHKSKGSQLIFTTHNTNLLHLDKMRKDQIWFVNKKESGATDLYSLYDYKDFNERLDLEKSYLLGRFDAIPNVIYPS